MILDLKALAKTGLLDATLARPVKDSTLNALLALPGVSRLALRRRLSSLLSNEGSARVSRSCCTMLSSVSLACPRRLATTPTSTWASIMQPTSGGCFAPTRR
jgi:hypothetical protein